MNKRLLQEVSSFKVVMVVFAFVLTACGTGGEDGAGGGKIAVTVNGTWKGTATNDTGGSANITLLLSQTGSNVSGSIDCSNVLTCPDSSGTVSGTRDGDTLDISVQWSNGNSCDSFDGTLTGDTLNGKYSCLVFGGVQPFTVTGSWTATLQ